MLIPPLPRVVITEIVSRALSEDLGRGDVTTDATVPLDTQATCVLRAREALVLAGLDVFEATFLAVDPQLRVERRARDGDQLERGQVVAAVHGAANPILKGERVALNFVQRMSGVAT